MNQNQLMPATTFMTADPAAIAAAESAKARIQSAYIMALQKPRNEDQARVNIIEACKRPEFAKLVEFSKPVGGRKIKGPSIRFAELALREWGNIDSDIQVVFEDAQIRRVKVRELDLERNSSFSSDINVNKTVERKNPVDREIVGERINTQGEKVYIVLATEDEFANKAGSLISKAIRNEGLRLIPQDIIDEAIETARQTLKDQDARDPNAAKKAVLDSFATIGIKPIELERYLGHGLDTIAPAELEDLRRVYRSIRDGEATWQDFVKPQDEPKKPAQAADYGTKETPVGLKTKPATSTTSSTPATTKSTPSTDGEEEARILIAEKIFNQIRVTRKLFAANIKANVDVIRDDMTAIQKVDLKAKWLRSSREEVNGVEKGEVWPLDEPAASPPPSEEVPESSSGDTLGGESISSESSSGTENGKTNGFTFCPKTGQRPPEALCENCVDKQDCEETKHFLSECRIFEDTLGSIIFRSIVRNIVGDADPKKVPISQFTDVLVDLNAAVDQKNA